MIVLQIMPKLFELQHFSANQLHSGQYIFIKFKGTVNMILNEYPLTRWPV